MNRRWLVGLVNVVVLFAAAVLGYQGWQTARYATVIVEWSTASELETAGYNLYRAESAGQVGVQVNDGLIAASADPLTGGDYRFEDKGLEAGRTYYYRLEEVEFDGQSSQVGEVPVTAEAGGRLELAAAGALTLASLLGLWRNFRGGWRTPAAQPAGATFQEAVKASDSLER